VAKFNEADGSLRPPPPPPKVKRKPRKVEWHECRACGFSTRLNKRGKMISETQEGMCLGCARHFGICEPFGMNGGN